MEVTKNKYKLRKFSKYRIYLNYDLSKKYRELEGHFSRKAQGLKENRKTVNTGFWNMFVEGEEWLWADMAKSQETANTKN